MIKDTQSSEHAKKNVSRGIFILAFVLSVTMGIVIGIATGEAEKLMSFQGALIGACAAAVAVLASFLILRVAFPVKTEKTTVSYLMGAITLFVGIVSFLAWGYIFVEQGYSTIALVFLVITLLAWLAVIIVMGMETPVFLALILGGVLGALFYAGMANIFPQQFLGDLVKDEQNLQELTKTIQLVYGLLGAFIGGLGTTIARASGFGLREPYHVEEL